MTLNKAKGKMFKSVGWTWTPLPGCDHGCKFCWAESLTKRFKRSWEPHFRPHYLKDKMPDDGSWIFVGSMGDTFCKGMKTEWILKLLDFIKENKANNVYLLMTKNPERFLEFLPRLEEIKDKVILGTTLETTGATPWSSAPPTNKRAQALELMKVMGFKTFLSLEPLADFDLERMVRWIDEINPEAIEIGLENYTNFTTPPHEHKIIELLFMLEGQGIHYILKENLAHLNDSSMETVKDE